MADLLKARLRPLPPVPTATTAATASKVTATDVAPVQTTATTTAVEADAGHTPDAFARKDGGPPTVFVSGASASDVAKSNGADVVLTKVSLEKDARWLQGAALRALADDAPASWSTMSPRQAWDAKCGDGLVSVVRTGSLCGDAVVVTPRGEILCDANALRLLDRRAVTAALTSALAQAASFKDNPSIAARMGHIAGDDAAGGEVALPCPGGVVHYPAGGPDLLLGYTLRALTSDVRAVRSISPYTPDQVGTRALPGDGACTWSTVDGDALKPQPPGEPRPGMVVIKGPGDFGALNRHASFHAHQIASLQPGGTLMNFQFRCRDVVSVLPLGALGLAYQGVVRDVCGDGNHVEVFAKQRDVPADTLLHLIRLDRALAALHNGRFTLDVAPDPELARCFPSSVKVGSPTEAELRAAVHQWLEKIGDPALTRFVHSVLPDAPDAPANGDAALWRQSVASSGVDQAQRPARKATEAEQKAAIELLRAMASGAHPFVSRPSDYAAAIAAKNVWYDGHELDTEVGGLVSLASARSTLHALVAYNKLADVDAPVPEAVFGPSSLDADVRGAARHDPALAAALTEAMAVMQERRKRLGL